MNKKIFTLLASSLMLFMAVFAVNAQSITGDTVKYLPKGVGKGAYHIHVTSVGDTVVAAQNLVLASDSVGYLYLADASTLRDSTYKRLRESLWCVNVIRAEQAGQVPTFVFSNKEYAWDLGVWGENSSFTGPGYPASVAGRPIKAQARGAGDNPERVLIDGVYMHWAFSTVYDNVPLEKNQFLKVELGDDADYFLTFAVNPAVAPTSTSVVAGYADVRLIKVHANDFKPSSAIYPYLLRFTLVKAGARVLDAEEFNTKIGEQTLAQTKSEGGIDFFFDKDVTKTESNPFTAKKLWAINAPNAGDHRSQYLFIEQQYNSGKYITVLDGDTPANYHNKLGDLYPKIATTAKNAAGVDGQNEFRFVYYPSEDSVVINVRKIDHISLGVKSDKHLTTDPYLDVPPNFDLLYNWEIQNHLIVRMQDLDAAEAKRVITVSHFPAKVRANFGIKDCREYDKNRATVESGLYTITDSRGWHLVMDLEMGAFTPRWRKLTSSEDPTNRYGHQEIALKTPAYQWMVTKIIKDSKTSRIHITNREYDHIHIEYVQIYNEWMPFAGQWNIMADYNTGAGYQPAMGQSVRVSSFDPVYDDEEAADMKKDLGTNWMAQMPEHLMQKLYRSSPFIGYKYIAPDTLNYYGYALNYLTYKGDDFFIGLNNVISSTDSMMHINRTPTYFELVLPDTLQQAIGGSANNRPTEEYGIGHVDTLLNRFSDEDSKEYIAKLERSYYNLMVNDYWRYSHKRNDQYIVLDDGKRYSFTPEPNANARKLKKSKFYLRFTYDDKYKAENYILIDRIEKSDFEYMTTKFNIKITDTLKGYEVSHGAITTKAFGVVQAAVDETNAFVIMQPKVLGNARASAFSLKQINEPLYRRFNVASTDAGNNDDDTPRLLKFVDPTNDERFLYEDANSGSALPHGQTPRINYLNMESIAECAGKQQNKEGNWHTAHNYIIYVDTAYVNRGTGWIKPQYLLVMDPKISEEDNGRVNACGDPINVDRYIHGRYLINATDSARENGFISATNSAVRDKDYISGSYERLVFVDAIHMGDSLYLLKGNDISAFYGKCYQGDVPEVYLSKDKLIKGVQNGTVDVHRLDNNLHKDVVFSMRFTDKQVDNQGKPTNAPKTFFMESETTNRSTTKGRMIAPMNGGWVKLHNLVPVIGRGTFEDAITQAQPFDVVKAEKQDPGAATSTDDVAVVKVMGRTGDVMILNAAGKHVVISNILGQTVIGTTLTTDKEVISVPKGIVIVSIDGEAVKAVVK